MSTRLLSALVLMIVLLAAPMAGQRRRGGGGRSGGGGVGGGGLSPELAKAAVAHFEGTLRNFDKKQVVVESDDGQTLVFRRTKSTKIQPKDIELGVRVSVEAHKDAVGDLDAVSVCAGKCSSGGAAAPASAK